MELLDVHNRSPSGGSGVHNRSPINGDSHNRSPTGIGEQIESCDIENGHTINRRHTSCSLNHVDYQSLSKRDIENPVSVSDVVKTMFLILAWYTISTFLTLYNKTLLGDDLGKFPAPLLMNTIHFVMQAVLSTAITWIWPERFHSSVMSWRDYFARVVPTALSTAMDVNLSNASLVFISVTFATMCKSASPIFLLVFAFAFRLESPSVKLFGIMFVISVGVLLTVAKETEFDFWGFVFVMLAAVMSGFRWTMTQILLQVQEAFSILLLLWLFSFFCKSFFSYTFNSKYLLVFFSWVASIGWYILCADIKTTMKKESYGLKNPVTLMSYVTPIMALTTGLLSLLLDPWQEFKRSDYFDSTWNIIRSCLLMLFGGTLAFFMVLTEYVLVSVTSAVTVTVAGVVKEAVTILVAVFYFHDEFTWLKGYGLITIMFGVSLFNWYKYQKLNKSKKHIGSPIDGSTPKYTIIDDMDEEESSPLRTPSPHSDQ